MYNDSRTGRSFPFIDYSNLRTPSNKHYLFAKLQSSGDCVLNLMKGLERISNKSQNVCLTLHSTYLNLFMIVAYTNKSLTENGESFDIIESKSLWKNIFTMDEN